MWKKLVGSYFCLICCQARVIIPVSCLDAFLAFIHHHIDISAAR